MALSLTTESHFGITIENAYHRVEAVALEGKTALSFRLRSYAQPTGVPSFKEGLRTCDYELNGSNPIQQAYEHLKTLPEFADAVDC